MPGGTDALYSTGESRNGAALSRVIDLTEDDESDESDEKGREKREESSKKIFEKSDKEIIDLSLSSDDEPFPPAISEGKRKSAALPENAPMKTSEKPPSKVPNYQNGGTYSLLSEGESDDEPRIQVPTFVSKQNGGISSNDDMARRSSSRPGPNGAEAESTFPPHRQNYTARKTAHRKSNSGSVGLVSSNLKQENKASASSSARSTPGELKIRVTSSRPVPPSNTSDAVDEQSSSKAMATSTASASLAVSAIARESGTRISPFVNPVSSLYANDPFSGKDGLGSHNDNESLKDLDSRKEKDFLRSSLMEGEASYNKSTVKEDKHSSRLISKEASQGRHEVVGRGTDDVTSAGATNRGIDRDDDTGHKNHNKGTPEWRLQADRNDSLYHAENGMIDKYPSGVDNPEVRKVVYRKKGNHGGARRGPAWEKLKEQMQSSTRGRGAAGDEAADDDDDKDDDYDDDDDTRPTPQKRRKTGQDLSKYLVSKPLSTRSASTSYNSPEEERSRKLIAPALSKENSSTSDAFTQMVRQENSMDEIKETFGISEEAMMEDWSLSLEALLEKRHLRALIALDNDTLDDDESPFASLRAPDRHDKGAIKLNIQTTMKQKTSNYALPIIVGDGGVERTPSYTHHTNVLRNHLTGDDDILRYVPLVVQNEEKFMNKFEKDLHTAYAERNDDPREKEQIYQIDRHVDVFLENMGYGYCNRDALIRYYLGHKPEKLPYPMKEKRLVLETLGGPLSGDKLRIMGLAAEEMSAGFDIDMGDVVLSQSRFKALVEDSKDKLYKPSGDQPPPPERLETMAQFSCLICHGAACTTHGEYNYQKTNKNIPSDGSSEIGSPDPSSFKKSNYEYVWEKFIMHCPDVMRKHNARDHSNKNENWHPEHWNTEKDTAEACGEECYRGRTEWTNHAWTQGEESELKSILLVTKPKKPCILVDIFDKPCWQIYSKILDLEEESSISRSKSLRKQQQSERADWYDPAAVPRNRGLKPGWQDSTVAHLHNLRVQPVPCVHEGPCRRELHCYCVINNLLCEQFCGCTEECERRFAGCSCHAEGLTCSSDTCICFQMNRECGDQCDSCGAIPRLRPQDRYNHELFQHGCQNIALQRGVNKKLILGKSPIPNAGFGLFTAEPVKKGDFISEYTGEVISDNEAERRGLGYDARRLSFLFTLNKEWVIDATRMGNKTRFINHAESEAEGMNCAPKVLFVQGEHRIAFRATRNILIGEELLFDYGPTFAEIHDLNKKSGDRKGKTKGNKATTNEASEEKGAKRGKMGEKRKVGWPKGRPRPKASKKAKVREYDVAGPSNAHSHSRSHSHLRSDQEGNDDRDEIMLAFFDSLCRDMIQDSDPGDETFIGKLSDVEMGDAGNGDADGGEDENEDEERVRRTSRTRTMPVRYTL
ncbi:09ea3aa8-8c58-486d-a680-a9fe3095b2d6-CDS [Sclerotinia trifoliorum]|uniref:09ea3aa8-8c58-486d-a680-a9fe3095b2d6-CDS n=1 Tax=Sclerotinia trifoliorum TaxID=28548 RepID=A0A8H2VWS6_9HELO|nr:09ea3aa8-8c58-486d-a680-a9fe3095b2d6-CDS [Sclerotinia trifoliorum]